MRSVSSLTVQRGRGACRGRRARAERAVTGCAAGGRGSSPPKSRPFCCIPPGFYLLVVRHPSGRGQGAAAVAEPSVRARYDGNARRFVLDEHKVPLPSLASAVAAPRRGAGHPDLGRPHPRGLGPAPGGRGRPRRDPARGPRRRRALHDRALPQGLQVGGVHHHDDPADGLLDAQRLRGPAGHGLGLRVGRERAHRHELPRGAGGGLGQGHAGRDRVRRRHGGGGPRPRPRGARDPHRAREPRAHRASGPAPISRWARRSSPSATRSASTTP